MEIKMKPRNTAVSLFTSGGLGDLAIRESNFEILVSNELLEDRHQVFQFNFSDTHSITGDIWELVDRIELAAFERLKGEELTLLYATPPCQGMSKNGRGKLLNAVRAGQKPSLDERNRLIIPTMDLACRLKPKILILENVPEMAETLILDENARATNIIDYIRCRLGPEYTGGAEVVEFANYGVPQRRQRLITVFTREPSLAEWFATWGTFMPPTTHSASIGEGKSEWVTVRDVIADLPPLDAKEPQSATSNIPYHRVPLLDPMKYWWVSNTPPERSAFDNQCVSCGCSENPTHSAKHDKNGINRASRDTPLYCGACGEMLPRPSVVHGATRVLMRGFTSAYKRMPYDKPASALTRNLSYACSDNKIHPVQNRVLSLYEAFRIHSLDRYDYEWRRADGKRLSDKTVREIIGESIPPAGFQRIIDHIGEIFRGQASPEAVAGPLFSASLNESSR